MTATRFKTWALVATALVGWILFFTAMGRLEESQASSWAELQNLREAAGLLAGIKTTIDSANQELRQASADRDHAQAEANQARQRIAELRRETNEVAQAINARQQEVVSLQRESETVRQQTIETQAELQRLQELATTKAAELDWSEQLVQAARARKATLDSELSVGAEQTAALDRERTKLEQALAELRSARDKTASELQTFSEQRELLRNENARLTDELTANKREFGDLDDRLQATRLEIAAAAARLTRVLQRDTIEISYPKPSDNEPILGSDDLQRGSSTIGIIPLPPTRPNLPARPQERSPNPTDLLLREETLPPRESRSTLRGSRMEYRGSLSRPDHRRIGGVRATVRDGDAKDRTASPAPAQRSALELPGSLLPLRPPLAGGF